MKILDKQVIAGHNDIRLVRFIVEAPDIAKKAKAGQFIVVMASEFGERVPLTIVDIDINKNTVTFIVQEIGFSTSVIGKLDIGDSFYALVGPLGRATKIENKEKAILIAGGVGIAEIHLLAKALKQSQNNVTVIIGAKTKNFLILEEELCKIVDELHITTDDGSHGKKAL